MSADKAYQFRQISDPIPEPVPDAEEATFVIFGASGDLTARKLLPALYALWNEGYLSDNTPIIGSARRPISDEDFRSEMYEAIKDAARHGTVERDTWDKFASRLFYRKADIEEPDDFPNLKRAIEKIEEQCGVKNKLRIAYLATAPSLFLPCVEAMQQADMIPSKESPEKLRVVFEKPYGRDLESAQELTRRLANMLREEQIYRIDHYLGKETVQNILLFRLGNSIFEPLLNRNHVDHVQITVAETQGIERGRGGYYDRSGALRDVIQNHALQLLALIAMEPPAMFRAKDIRDEKMKVLEALAPGSEGPISDWAIGGQYTAGEVKGKPAVGYREEDRVDPKSNRETYVAMECRVENWRWAGVPFYLRTGKRLPKRVTEIAIQFKLPPKHLFTTVECEGDICDLVGAQPNLLVFRIQPSESISLSFSTKRPGMQYQIHPVTMDFAYTTFQHNLPEAYERLLLDVMRSDSTLFTRSDELEAAWRFVMPILDYWESGDFEPEPYFVDSWGPKAAADLLASSGRHWRVPPDGTEKTPSP